MQCDAYGITQIAFDIPTQAMSSSTPKLRPMTAGDILDQAIRIYRYNFVPLVIIVAIVSVPIAILQVIAEVLAFPLGGLLGANTTDAVNNFDTPLQLLGQAIRILAALIAAVAALFQNGAITAFVSERFLGRAITVRQAYGRAFRRWLSLLLAAFLVGLLYAAVLGIIFGVWLVPFFGLALAGTNLDSVTSGIFGALTLLLCCLFVPAMVILIFFNTRWAFFIQAIVLENFNSTGGLGRSWKLVKGSFWRVMLMVFVLIIIVYAFSTGPILLVSFGALALASPILLAVANTIISSLIQIVMTPLQFAALTVLYYDLRIRKEGFDLEMQMANLPPAPTQAIPPAPAADAPSDVPPPQARDDSLPQ